MASTFDHTATWDDWDKPGGQKALSEPDRAAEPQQGRGMRHFDQLLRTIEGEIIPRLMLAHRTAHETTVSPVVCDRGLGVEEVAEFTGLVLRHDILVASSYLEAMRTQGVPLETLFLELLAPTARRLGDLWNTDLCSFAEVTLGLGRLQQLLRDLTPSFHHESDYRCTGHRALLAPAPGEQHTFGVFMVAEFMRRAGWDVCEERTASLGGLLGRVRGERFDLVGLSLSSETRLDELSNSIRTLRRSSRNPEIGVMVGGSLFISEPDLVARVGADATAGDARCAPGQAEGLLQLLANRR